MTEFPLHLLGRGATATKGKRIYLTPVSHDFASEILEFNVGNVRQEFIPFQNKDEVSFWIEKNLKSMQARTKIELVILHQKSNEFLGMISVRNLDQIAEFGIWLKPTAQKQGYALEAMKLFMEWLGQELPPRTYMYTAQVTNTSSIRLALKAGFTYTGEKVRDGQSHLFLKIDLPQANI